MKNILATTFKQKQFIWFIIRQIQVIQSIEIISLVHRVFKNNFREKFQKKFDIKGEQRIVKDSKSFEGSKKG